MSPALSFPNGYDTVLSSHYPSPTHVLITGVCEPVPGLHITYQRCAFTSVMQLNPVFLIGRHIVTDAIYRHINPCPINLYYVNACHNCG